MRRHLDSYTLADCVRRARNFTGVDIDPDETELATNRQ
jgi:hypothetical protein